MKRRIVACFIISTFFVASSIVSMEQSDETIFVSKESKEDSPPTPRKVPPISLGKPSTSLSGPNSPRGTSSLVPRAQSELITERREKIRKEHESAYSLTFPDGSHTTDEVPSRRKLTQEEKEKITQGVAPFREQIEESDKALAALKVLKKIEDRDSKSRSRSSSPSGSDENDPDVTAAAQDILYKAGSSGLVTITARDGSRIQPYPKPDADDKPSHLPSDGTLRRFLDESESSSSSEEPEPTLRKALTEKKQKQLEKYQGETEDERLVRLSKEVTKRLRQEEELAQLLQQDQDDDAARLQKQPSAQNVRQTTTETESTTPQTKSLPKTKPTQLQLITWCKQHPVITTVAGLGISVVTFLVLLYYLDKSPDDVIQWLMSCSPKYNPSSHSSL